MVAFLTEDVRVSMPPMLLEYLGRDAVDADQALPDERFEVLPRGLARCPVQERRDRLGQLVPGHGLLGEDVQQLPLAAGGAVAADCVFEPLVDQVVERDQ
jgi:hypothetical protein